MNRSIKYLLLPLTVSVMIGACGIIAKRKAKKTAAIEAYYQMLGDRYVLEFNTSIDPKHPRRSYYSNTDENRLVLDEIKQKYANEDTIYFAISTAASDRPARSRSIAISTRFKKTLDSLLPSVEVLELGVSCIQDVPTLFTGIYFESEGHLGPVFQGGNKERVLIRTEQWHDEGCDEYESKKKSKRKKRRKGRLMMTW